MENVAGVIDRIRAIESRLQTGVPRAGFQQALARATDAADTEKTVGTLSTVSDARELGWGQAGSALTLSQMLGRPVATSGAPERSQAADGAVAGTPLRLPVDARMSSPFGNRVHPVTGETKLHAGIDLAAPTGTAIAAAAGGTVSFAGIRGGYGNLVVVEHGDGTQTRYAHQATIAVKVGQEVAAGDVLGTVGSTGLSTGPHLHFEFRRDGQPVDPTPMLGLS